MGPCQAMSGGSAETLDCILHHCDCFSIMHIVQLMIRSIRISLKWIDEVEEFLGVRGDVTLTIACIPSRSGDGEASNSRRCCFSLTGSIE